MMMQRLALLHLGGAEEQTSISRIDMERHCQGLYLSSDIDQQPTSNSNATLSLQALSSVPTVKAGYLYLCTLPRIMPQDDLCQEHGEQQLRCFGLSKSRVLQCFSIGV